MNKSIKTLACLAFFSLVITGCGNSSNGQNDGHVEPHVHNLEKDYRHDQKTHWHVCTGCNEQLDLEPHKFAIEVINPTYDQKGYTSYTCKVCGYSYQDHEVDKLEHHYSNEWTYGPETHWHECTDFGYEDLKEDEMSHNFVDEIVEPNYERGGYTVHTCEDCGYTYQDNETEKVEHHYSRYWTKGENTHWHACIDEGYENLKSDEEEHHFGNWETDQEATEYETGTKHQTCTDCGYVVNGTIDKLPHTHKAGEPKQENKVEPSCTEDGSYDWVTYCYECGEEMSREAKVIPATGHLHTDTRIENRVEPNCLEDGSYDLVTYCTDDNVVLSTEKIAVPALGHDLVHHSGKEANCTENGYQPYDTCSRCDYSTYQVIEATGHKYGEPTYTWNSDYSKCTAKMVCENDSNHVVEETVNSQYVVLTEPGIRSEGEGKYTATFVNEAFNKQEQNIVIDPTGTADKLQFRLYEDKYFVSASSTTIKGEVVIPKTYNGKPVFAIDYQGFKNCSSITSVEIPDSIVSIREDAFWGCGGIIKYVGTLQRWLSLNGKVEFKHDVHLYLDGTDVETTVVNIPENVTTINQYAFNKCVNLTEINLNDELTSIGNYAFSQSGITSISLTGNGLSVGSCAFEGCASLKTAAIGNTVTNLGYSAFQNCSALETVTIGSGLTTISDSLFKGCESLTSVTFGENVSVIAAHAFEDCSSLETINIPDGVTSIGTSAFEGCKSLSLVNIGNGLSTVSKYAFSETPNDKCLNYHGSLENWLNMAGHEYLSNFSGGVHLYLDGEEETTIINIPEGVTSLPNNIFSDCLSLTTINLSDTITEIGYNTFQRCTSLRNVHLSNSLKIVKNSTFSGCTSLESIVIPNSVTEIETSAFTNCPNIMSITLGSGLESIGNVAFSSCHRLVEIYNNSSLELAKGSYDNGGVAYYALDIITDQSASKLNKDANGFVTYNDGDDVWLVAYRGNETSITIPDNVTKINKCSLQGNSNLISVKLPRYLKTIGQSAFNNCSSLREIIIPDSCTTIETHAFSNCASLSSVAIGAGVTSIGESAFYGCYRLVEVSNKSAMTQFGSSYLTSYAKTVINDNEFHSKISWDQDGFWFFEKSGETYLIDYTGSSTDIEIPDKVTKINQYALYNKKSIKSIVVPDGVDEIEAYAFSGCSNLESVTIPNSVTSIGKMAFDDCNALKGKQYDNGIYLGNSDNPYHVLYKGINENITSIEIIDRCKIIGPRAFYDYKSLSTLVIPNSVISISPYACGFSSIASLTIGNKVTSIGDSAFAGCKSLTSVTIPNSVTSIGVEAFSNCTTLASLDLGKGVKTIGSKAFNGCSALTTITIPVSVTSLNIMDAFYGCSALSDAHYDGTTDQWLAMHGNVKTYRRNLITTIQCSNGDVELNLY